MNDVPTARTVVKTGAMKIWRECWSNGVMEYWNSDPIK